MIDEPLTEAEIALWVSSLGRTDTQRIHTLNNLLRFAVGDRMSGADRRICRIELERLKAKAARPPSCNT